jgi:hypothetical protein
MRVTLLRISLTHLVVGQFDVLIQHTHQALEHFAARARDLTQHNLGRQLPTKVALLIGNRIRIEVIEEFGQDIQFLGKRILKRSGN